jgi:hypothetical protein
VDCVSTAAKSGVGAVNVMVDNKKNFYLLVSCDYIYMSISKVCGMSVSGDELGIPTRIGAPF